MSPAGLRYEWRADRRVAASLARRQAALRGIGRLRAPDGGPLDCQLSGAAPTRHPEAICALTPSASGPASRPIEALASALGVSCAPPCTWLRIDMGVLRPALPCRRATSYLAHRSGILAWLKPATDLGRAALLSEMRLELLRCPQAADRRSATGRRPLFGDRFCETFGSVAAIKKVDEGDASDRAAPVSQALSVARRLR